MLTRRQMLIGSAALACWPSGCARLFPESGEALVNDIQSQLNATRVARVVRPASLLRNIFASVAEYEREMIRERVIAGLRKARASGKRIGRPRAVLNRLKIDQLRAEGLSWREVARRMALPASTVYRYRGLSRTTSATAPP